MWKLLLLSHHLAKFGDHRPCCSRDITDLLFHVTLQDDVIKGLCEFMVGSSKLYIPTLLCLVATNIVAMDINDFSLSPDLARSSDYMVM